LIGWNLEKSVHFLNLVTGCVLHRHSKSPLSSIDFLLPCVPMRHQLATRPLRA
jgi:hypothetical protein